MATQIKLPVARIIGGSVYQSHPRETDAGQPIYVKGSNPPVQAVDFSLGLAIPKKGEADWKQTQWGESIYKEGFEGHKNMTLSPAFSWKITDGDSQIPNKVGKINAQREGYAGHLIVWIKSFQAPQLCNTRGQLLVEKDAIYCGSWVQAVISCKPNDVPVGGAGTPGVYLNMLAVCFVGHGERIETSAVNVSEIVWDVAELPPGCSAIPLVAGDVPIQPAAPVVPNYAVLQPMPAAPVAPPPPIIPVRRMIGQAEGFTYEQMTAAGWTDETLLAAGMMII